MRLNQSFRERWTVRVISLFAAGMGVVNLISATQPALAERFILLEQFSPLEVTRGGYFTAALAGFALLLLSFNLWRRKRVAWWTTIFTLGIAVIAHMLKGVDYEEASLSIGLLILLLVYQHQFYALSDLPSIRYGFLILGLSFLFTLFYGTIGFYLLDRHFGVRFNLSSALFQTITMFTAFYDPGLQPVTGFGRYFADSIYGVGLVTLLYSALMLARPVMLRAGATSDQRSLAKQIIVHHGNSSLARLCLLDDKSYFSSQGKVVISYVAKGRVAIALGDPIGDITEMESAIQSFQAFCGKNDWIPAFYQTRPELLSVYHSLGLHSLKIGHEGIVDLASFTLEGGEHKGLRTSLNKLTRLGFRAELVEPPLMPVLLDTLRSISNEWLNMMHGTEKRFSVGWFDDNYVSSERVMTIVSPQNQIYAFANILPEYQKNEVTIDLMRRRREIPNGLMEFLFVSLFQWAKTQGYTSFSLGLSALSGVGDSPHSTAAEKALHHVYEHINRFYNFKGLHEFKDKFHPDWQPRFLIYNNASSLPDILTALIRADSGDDFWRSYLPHT